MANRSEAGSGPTLAARRAISWPERSMQLAGLLMAAAGLLLASTAGATTKLADQPLFSNAGVPGNLALALSVEFPTAVSVAHFEVSYLNTTAYLGYFDNKKCYDYSWSAIESERHFYPAGLATERNCTGKWSGNFLNWATMQTIDPFRWALTGGYRSLDTTAITLLEKAWASGQGGTGNFPNRTASGSTLVSNATPFNWSDFKMRVQGLGNKLRFTRSGDVNTAPTVYNPANGVSSSTVYEVSVRVKVCDASAAAGGIEDNCKSYPAGTYKPTGLIQQYAGKIRYSAFGYLNDSNKQRDGGVLRARQKFVGPNYTLPGENQTTNSNSEWDANNGILALNPDPTDAATTATALGVTIGASGVINYVNKFGQVTPGSYKTYDNVSELYYAALRYYRNLGNVPEWTSMAGASTATKTTWADGFPVITSWDDPIKYSCQRNFVLGIGDVNTWTDKNLPGNTGTTGEPAKPAAVSADTSVDAKVATDKVGSLHGMGANLGSATNAQEIPGSYYIAGLAYDANAKDIRPDDATKPWTMDKQTVQTYWLDVLEYSTYKNNNPYYLAAKYGGAKLPDTFDPYTRNTDLPVEWWNTGGGTVYGQTKPNNYFVASKADEMVSGLTDAFRSISDNLSAFTTSFSTNLPQLTSAGTASFSAKYDAANWSGELTASTATYNTTTQQPDFATAWTFSTKLASQVAGTGWNTERRIVTFNTQTKTGVPFRQASLSPGQQTALNTAYRTGDDTVDYVNYLRGEKKHEVGSSETDSAKAYRARPHPLGDIVGSMPRVVGKPMAPLSSSSNPGYDIFKNDWKNRKNMVYVGSNNGMLHAVDGTLTDTTSGKEVFAYVPGALYEGPTGSPQTTGLASRGNPEFAHRYLVDATPAVFDIDFGRTPGGTGTHWRTVLLGGLGKGGRSYYALDITDPGSINIITGQSTAESTVAGRVLWEFTDSDLGYTYGEPTAVKTKAYGWVLIFGSGYNNADGKGYFFIVNPRTGALIQKISTGEGATAAQAGLAHVQAFVLDRSDNTADSVYAGDLLGNLWRLDLRAADGAYPAPVKLATLTDSNNNPRPVTTRPTIIVQPGTLKRWVTVGTGRLLDTEDVASTQSQAMVAIMDGNGLAFNSSAPAGFSFPITPAELLQLTDLTRPTALDTTRQIGWYVDLGLTTGQGWRVITDPSAFYGSVEFTTTLPGGNACSPSGKSRVYSIDLGTGQSDLVAGDGSTPIAFNETIEGMATEQRSYGINENGTVKRMLVVGDNKGKTKGVKTKQMVAPGLRRLNWRELPLAH